MSKVNDLERQVQGLSVDELAAFRQWFAEFDAEAWDRQVEADVKAGKLDSLAERARQAHTARRHDRRRNLLVLDRDPCRVRQDRWLRLR